MKKGIIMLILAATSLPAAAQSISNPLTAGNAMIDVAKGLRTKIDDSQKQVIKLSTGEDVHVSNGNAYIQRGDSREILPDGIYTDTSGNRYVVRNGYLTNN